MILVTGASGFVGSAVVETAAARWPGGVRAASRRIPGQLTPHTEHALVGDLSDTTDWRAALRDVETVVHTAARVHVMRDTASDPLAVFRQVNVEGTLRLARQAAEAGVRRLIFVSSIKVNGEETQPGRPFTASDVPSPIDPYGQSKREAEEGLRALERETGLDVVVVRPVMVYGPGAKGNFRSMVRWLERGVPLPLASVQNQRSVVALDNLVDLLLACVDRPAAKGNTFLVSDGESLSTPSLLRRTAAALNTRARLFPVSPRLLLMAGRLLGREDLVHRLCSSLEIDMQTTRNVLQWQPVVSVDEGLRRAVR